MTQYNWMPKWIPKKSFGSLVFGNHISQYQEKLGLGIIIPADSKNDWETYEVSGSDVSIDTEAGMIINISVFDKCIYRSQNIIGMNIIDIANLLEVSDYDVGETIIHNDGDMQTPIEFDDYGLQAWFSCNILVHASLSNFTEDD